MIIIPNFCGLQLSHVTVSFTMKKKNNVGGSEAMVGGSEQIS